MIGRLIGRLVLVGLVVFGSYFVITHYNGHAGRFGCAAAGLAVAHADSGNCPVNIGAAAGDARWAADRIATIPRITSATTGLFYQGVLVINNSEGPCPGAYSCQQVLDVLLPPGASLTVWWPGDEHETFTGRS